MNRLKSLMCVCKLYEHTITFYMAFQTAFQNFQNCAIQINPNKADFKSCLIYYLDHVWLPVRRPSAPHLLSLLLALTNKSSFVDSKESRLKCRINHSERRRTSFFFSLSLALSCAFIAVPGELGRFLISEIEDNSRFPSDHISVSVPCRSNLDPAERCFH